MKEVTNKDVNYDVFINTGLTDSKLAPKNSTIHIDLENMAMSDDIMKKIEFDLKEIFSDLININPDDIKEKKANSPEVASYGKIRFSLDELNLSPDAKEKLLKNLHFYAKKRGLFEFEDSAFVQDSRET